MILLARRGVSVRVAHRDQWPHPANHLDGRVCPVCRAETHGNTGQRGHEQWHDEMWEELERLHQLVADLYGLVGQGAEYARREEGWARVRWSATEQGQPVDMSPVHAIEGADDDG